MQKNLELETGKQLVESINRLVQLQTLNADDANSKAEAAGLEAYIRNTLFEHAGALMGHWYAVRTEYEPLCNAFASIANRAFAIQAQRRQIDAAAQAAVKQETGTVTEGDAMAPLPGESNLIAPEGAPLILKGNFGGKPKAKR